MEQQGIESRNRLMHVERSVDHVAKQVGDLGSKIDTVVNALTTVTAQPKFDIFKVLPAAAAVVVIVGAVGTLITYIAGNVNAVDYAKLEARQEFIRERLDRGWFTGSSMTIRSPGGTVAPQL